MEGTTEYGAPRKEREVISIGADRVRERIDQKRINTLSTVALEKIAWL